MIQKSEAGAAGGDLLLQAERAGSRVGIHDEHEIEQAGFFRGYFGG